MNIEGTICRLRALEPDDLDTMYRWENDTNIWRVSGTTAPFSRHSLMRLIDEQCFDIYATRQQRLVIETTDTPQPAMAGAVDLVDYLRKSRVVRASRAVDYDPRLRQQSVEPLPEHTTHCRPPLCRHRSSAYPPRPPSEARPRPEPCPRCVFWAAVPCRAYARRGV